MKIDLHSQFRAHQNSEYFFFLSISFCNEIENIHTKMVLLPSSQYFNFEILFYFIIFYFILMLDGVKK